MTVGQELACALYMLILPLVVWGTRERGASRSISILLGICWAPAYLIGLFYLFARSAR